MAKAKAVKTEKTELEIAMEKIATMTAQNAVLVEKIAKVKTPTEKKSDYTLNDTVGTILDARKLVLKSYIKNGCFPDTVDDGISASTMYFSQGVKYDNFYGKLCRKLVTEIYLSFQK